VVRSTRVHRAAPVRRHLPADGADCELGPLTPVPNPPTATDHGHPRPTGCARGYRLLDLACIHPSGQKIAIEVDGDNNIWSIEKLAAEADTGKLAIWVKWGRPANLILVPDTIGVVEVRAEPTRLGPDLVYSRQAHAFFAREPADLADARAIASTL
jgi:hypothetical protein